MVLHVEDVAPLLIEAVPTFGPLVDHLYAPGRHLPHKPGDGWDAVGFAHHLADLLAAGDSARFPAAFAAIERLLREGDDEVLRTYRLFFFLQLRLRARDRFVEPERFEQWLSPTARAAWADAVKADEDIQRMAHGRHSFARAD